ncbi:hypothetical protein BD626DRAFT_515162 [Schizophyllum amplum]|uniref:Uncharacterized protein n=1 Tax=Schizophyllum amplum TaxID=97359 RepID=A0A550BXY6_9AGAR|nr:hypothetical protein BD626DRAFT_515162 [Auriculariopsis ampla]
MSKWRKATIIVEYDATKSLNMALMDHQALISLLRADLIKLKFPHPKTESIAFPSPGTASFYWDSVPYDSNLLTSLRDKTDKSRREIVDLMQELRVRDLRLEEIPSFIPPPPKPHQRPEFPLPLNPSRRLDEEAEALLSEVIPKQEQNDPNLFGRNMHPPPAPGQSGDIYETAMNISPPRSPEVPGMAAQVYTAFESEPRIGFATSSSYAAPYNNNTGYKPSPYGSSRPFEPSPKELEAELAEIRGRISSTQRREAEIVDQLQKLRYTKELPSELSEESRMRLRLRAVEHELQSERIRRVEAEGAIQDVRKECRHPFVMPTLLDAFIAVTRIQSQSVQQQGGQ